LTHYLDQAVPSPTPNTTQLFRPIRFDRYYLQDLPEPPETIAYNPEGVGAKISVVEDETIACLMIPSVWTVVRGYEAFSKYPM
jgi:hypothetical protein